MAADPTVTGVRGNQTTFNGQPLMPFAGVTITDPTPNATDTVDIGVFPVGASLKDGVGYSGLMNQPLDVGAAHIGQYYLLQCTASQVTAELDTLILTPAADVIRNGVDFEVDSSSGASSANNAIAISDSSEKPNIQVLVNVRHPDETIFLEPFNVVFNHNQAHTTFVFSPGDELDMIRGFRFAGTSHDTMTLSGSDFGNSIADVLRNTGDIQGSAWITDPKTGDAIRLAGVTKADLKAHPKDFAFV